MVSKMMENGNLSVYAISRILCMKGFLLQLVTAQSAQLPQHKRTSLSPSQIATTCNNNGMYIMYGGWNGNPKSTAGGGDIQSYYYMFLFDTTAC